MNKETRGIRNRNPVACNSATAKNAEQNGIKAEQVASSPHHSTAASGAPSRGLRNNNPLNIRKSNSKWKGMLPREEQTDRAFVRFIGMEYGFRAAFILVRNYITEYGCNSIEKIVSRWAPKADGNNTEKYITDVCRLTGIGGKAPLAPSDSRLKDIVWAMAQIESGAGILESRAYLERGWEMSL